MSRSLINEEQLYGEVYVAWLKDTHEKPSPESQKTFRELTEKTFKDKDVVLRTVRLGSEHCHNPRVGAFAHTQLSKLDLYGNMVRDTGCEAIGQLMRECPNVTHLNLGSNDIGSQGILTLSNVLATHKKMQVLVLGSREGDVRVNRIEPSCAKTLLEALSRVKTLKVLDLSRAPHWSWIAREPFRCSSTW